MWRHDCAAAAPLSMNQSTHRVGINTISVRVRYAETRPGWREKCAKIKMLARAQVENRGCVAA
jgi:hypothetical protein